MATTTPSELQSITFGDKLIQSMEIVMLPSGLQNITFGLEFDQSMESDTLSSGLQSITFGFGLMICLDRACAVVAVLGSMTLIGGQE